MGLTRRRFLQGAVSAMGASLFCAPLARAFPDLSSPISSEGWSIPIAIVYPELPEPYAQAFFEICRSVEERFKAQHVVLRNTVEPAELAKQIKRSGARAVIALGHMGEQAVSKVVNELPVVLGALIYGPSSEVCTKTGISLLSDPEILLSKLKELAPSVKRLYAPYGTNESEWLLGLARDTSRTLGIEVIGVETKSLASSLKFYESFVSSPLLDPKRDAVWLLPDRKAVDDLLVLPFVLKESWHKRIAVVSSKGEHVRRGALLGVLPNNVELGRSLATAAMELLGNDQRRKNIVAPLRDVYLSMNRRAAGHLGLRIAPSIESTFTSIYPES